MFQDEKGRLLLRELYRRNKESQGEDSIFLKLCMKNLYNNTNPLSSHELADVASSTEYCVVFEGIMFDYLSRFPDMSEDE